MMTGLRTPHVFTVPGEHDSIDDAGQKYLSAFGAGTRGDGWYSFDIAGVHVIALVNTLNLKKLGHLGVDQLEFVAKDVAALPNDTPIIVFSHIPLFAMYPDWGWGTDDAAQALSYLRRFSSVTCLNGHVHQVFSKTEGNVTFYSGTTTAYPLPHPGDGPAPKPVTLPAGKLHDALGIREVGYIRGQNALALKEKDTAMTFVTTRIGIAVATGRQRNQPRLSLCPWLPAHSDDRHCFRRAGQRLVRCRRADPDRRSGVACSGPRPRWPAAHWPRSCCRAPSDSSGFPNEAGSRRRTRRSAWSPSC